MEVSSHWYCSWPVQIITNGKRTRTMPAVVGPVENLDQTRVTENKCHEVTTKYNRIVEDIFLEQKKKQNLKIEICEMHKRCCKDLRSYKKCREVERWKSLKTINDLKAFFQEVNSWGFLEWRMAYGAYKRLSISPLLPHFHVHAEDEKKKLRVY